MKLAETTTHFSQFHCVSGMVLCGGRSSRMGVPKESLLFGGETSLQRTVRILRTVLPYVVVVGSQETEFPAFPDEVLPVRDETPYQGPLSGLLTGLKSLPAQFTAIYLTGCDTPLIRPDFIKLVISQLSETTDIAAVDDGERLQPIAAAYHTRISMRVSELLSSSERSLQALLKASLVNRISLTDCRAVDPELDSLKNMNTPADYSLLQAQLLKTQNADKACFD